MLQAGLDDRATGADRLGGRLTAGPSRATLTVRVEEESRALPAAGAVQLPVPDLGDGGGQAADVSHSSSSARCEPEKAVRLHGGRCPRPLRVKPTATLHFVGSALPPLGESGWCHLPESIKVAAGRRSEEHTSNSSHANISYAVF